MQIGERDGRSWLGIARKIEEQLNEYRELAEPDFALAELYFQVALSFFFVHFY